MFWLGYKNAYLFGIGLGLVVTGLLFNLILYALPIKSIAFASQNECFYTSQYSYLGRFGILYQL